MPEVKSPSKDTSSDSLSPTSPDIHHKKSRLGRMMDFGYICSPTLKYVFSRFEIEIDTAKLPNVQSPSSKISMRIPMLGALFFSSQVSIHFEDESEGVNSHTSKQQKNHGMALSGVSCNALEL